MSWYDENVVDDSHSAFVQDVDADVLGRDIPHTVTIHRVWPSSTKLDEVDESKGISVMVRFLVKEGEYADAFTYCHKFFILSKNGEKIWTPRQQLATLCRSMGYRVVTMKDCIEAIEKAKGTWLKIVIGKDERGYDTLKTFLIKQPDVPTKQTQQVTTTTETKSKLKQPVSSVKNVGNGNGRTIEVDYDEREQEVHDNLPFDDDDRGDAESNDDDMPF